MRFLITAGPTREPIDPVRFLSNRSSGKMGYALADGALSMGHEVHLITGPVSLEPPHDAVVTAVESASEMFEAVKREIKTADVAIFCAAVSDYRIKEVAEEKIKKSDDELVLRLVKTPDILGSTRTEFKFGGYLVGFAAETENLEANAAEKLRRKGCNLLVANDVSRSDIGFDHNENEVRLFFADGRRREIPRAGKGEIAAKILEAIEGDL